MSSCPGLHMEDFLAWQYSLVVEDQADANFSVALAEAMGRAQGRRPFVTTVDFAKLVALFEPYREQIENRLLDFDEERQSWRGYAGAVFDIFDKEIEAQAYILIAGITAPVQPTVEKVSP